MHDTLTIKARIAFAVSRGGDWAAVGTSDDVPDAELGRRAIAALHWSRVGRVDACAIVIEIEAECPIPSLDDEVPDGR